MTTRKNKNKRPDTIFAVADEAAARMKCLDEGREEERRSRPRARWQDLPGYGDLPDDATADQLFRRSIKLRRRLYGRHTSKLPQRYLGRVVRPYVTTMMKHGVHSETLRDLYEMTPKQWKTILDPEFQGEIVVYPPIKDDGDQEWIDYNEQE